MKETEKTPSSSLVPRRVNTDRERALGSDAWSDTHGSPQPGAVIELHRWANWEPISISNHGTNYATIIKCNFLLALKIVLLRVIILKYIFLDRGQVTVFKAIFDIFMSREKNSVGPKT